MKNTHLNKRGKEDTARILRFIKSLRVVQTEYHLFISSCINKVLVYNFTTPFKTMPVVYIIRRLNATFASGWPSNYFSTNGVLCTVAQYICLKPNNSNTVH
jgi:hypothetical protein